MAHPRQVEFAKGIRLSPKTFTDRLCSGNYWRASHPPNTRNADSGWIHFIFNFATTKQPMKGNVPKVLIRGDESLPHPEGPAYFTGACRSKRLRRRSESRLTERKGLRHCAPPPGSRDFKNKCRSTKSRCSHWRIHWSYENPGDPLTDQICYNKTTNEGERSQGADSRRRITSPPRGARLLHWCMPIETIASKIGKQTDRAEGPTALCPPPGSRDFNSHEDPCI